MNNLSKEDWADWGQSVQTKAFIKELEKGIIDEKITRDITADYGVSNDVVARNLARSEGFCEGLKTAIKFIFELREKE